jgi:glyoxylase-like metal-dependent hydrolase (beta-lactamase superfamily II)
VLVDVGSGFGDSNDQLEAGLDSVRQDFGEAVSWEEISHVIISHGHIDHYGGLQFVREKTQAKIGIHELDLRVLIQYEERLMDIARRLREFLIDAGVQDHSREELMSLYLLHKQLFHGVSVDFTFHPLNMQLGPIRLIHVPGHCPGQVLLKVDDILLAGDHVLEHISPHQAPESLSKNTGLGHYLDSLRIARREASRVRITLSGHGKPIHDLSARVDAILQLHYDRLGEIQKLLSKPMTIAQVSEALFGEPDGYHALLALEETGAHIEYLHQRGYLRVDNKGDLEKDVRKPFFYIMEDDRQELEGIVNSHNPQVD